jgi:hypothetical protein
MGIEEKKESCECNPEEQEEESFGEENECNRELKKGLQNHTGTESEVNITTASTCQILWHGSCEKITQEPRQALRARICRSSEC